MSDAATRAERLAKARLLVTKLEAGCDAEADALARELADAENLADELGRMTRELHEALDALRVDPRISELASNEIPDARQKLGYVLALTEQAAHSVINAVEQGLPIASRLAASTGATAETLRVDGKRLHELLSEILMAQSFQDLSGQAIRRVIEVSGELERRLVLLVQRAGGRRGAGPASSQAPRPPVDRLQDQDEVDALLSGLGF